MIDDGYLVDAKSALASALVDAAQDLPDRSAAIAAFLIWSLGDEGQRIVDYALAMRRRQLGAGQRRDLVAALRSLALEEHRRLLASGLFGSRERE